MSSDEPPQLSVIIASTRDVQTLDRCLQALLPQTKERQVEVVVVGYVGQDEIRTPRYPDITVFPFPAETPLPTLFGAGLRQASASLLALTDSTTIVADDWVASLVDAHVTADSIIGGAVEPHPGQSATDWAAYFCDYGQFMLPHRAGPARALPGNNISFDRSLLACGREYVEPEFWKTYWCRHLQDKGVTLTLDPSVVVYNAKRYRLIPYLARRFRHGRCFGGMRIEKLSSMQRFFYAAGAPFLPLLFTLRITRAVLSKGRNLTVFFLTFPLIFAAVVSWSVGEWWGYIMGPGKSCDALI